MNPTIPINGPPGSPATNHECPICHLSLYDRHLKQCGYCGAAIPESLQYTAEEIAELDRETAKMDEQRKEREHDAQITSLTSGVGEGVDLSGLW